MDAYTTRNQARVEQCRKNAQAKSDKKCQAVLEALSVLKKNGVLITKAAVARQAGVSVVFLRSHPDLVQMIADAEKRPVPIPSTVSPSETAKDQVIAALRRRVEDLKRELSLRDMALREKQREIDRLYGKLAAASPSHHC